MNIYGIDIWSMLDKSAPPSKSVLTLGRVEFRTDELPESINFGGEQSLAIRKFPGGSMDIQAMGSFDDQITWSGTFMFQDAKERLQTVGMMRISAEPVDFVCSFIRRTVVVAKFTYDYVNDYYIPYQITLQPLIKATMNGTAIVSQQAASTTTTQAKVTHVVKEGETLWSIAVKYKGDGTKWTDIAIANNIKDPKILSAGTVLTIP